VPIWELGSNNWNWMVTWSGPVPPSATAYWILPFGIMYQSIQ